MLTIEPVPLKLYNYTRHCSQIGKGESSFTFSHIYCTCLLNMIRPYQVRITINILHSLFSIITMGLTSVKNINSRSILSDWLIHKLLHSTLANLKQQFNNNNVNNNSIDNNEQIKAMILWKALPLYIVKSFRVIGNNLKMNGMLKMSDRITLFSTS